MERGGGNQIVNAIYEARLDPVNDYDKNVVLDDEDLLVGSAVRVAVNQKVVDFDAPLAGATEVAFFPPMTGG